MVTRAVEATGEIKTTEVDELLSVLKEKGLLEGNHFEFVTSGGGDTRIISIIARDFCAEDFICAINSEQLKKAGITEKLTLA